MSNIQGLEKYTLNNANQEILLLQELLNIKFPNIFRDYLEDNSHCARIFSIPILGCSISLDNSSIWGATAFLRTIRPDLPPDFITIIPFDNFAICLDVQKGDEQEVPVVKINFLDFAPPETVCHSFEGFLQNMKMNPNTLSLFSGSGQDSVNNYWFQRGIERLEWHMMNLSFQYDHKDGGQLPRSHVWRPYRFCVQDIILGVTLIHHNRKYNRTEVDVFLTASTADYSEDSGCRALVLIILSDAYKSGGSMEIKFTNNVEGGRVPHELVILANNCNVHLEHISKGGISPKEANQLYMALTGFNEAMQAKIVELEEIGKISSANLCYGMHHGVWSIPELEIILFSSIHPHTILQGSYPTEVWHLFHHDLFHARNALMGGYLDLQLVRREHAISEHTESVKELEDDERNVEICFNSAYCSKLYVIEKTEQSIAVPWLYDSDSILELSPSSNLWVLLRARELEDLKMLLLDDLQQALQLKKYLASQNDNVCIMVTSDFKRLDSEERTRIREQFSQANIGLILCPDILNQLDNEVWRRFESIKVIRQ